MNTPSLKLHSNDLSEVFSSHQRPTVSGQFLFPADSLVETDRKIGLAAESGIRETCSSVTVTGDRDRSQQVKSRYRDLYGLRFASERLQYPRGPVPRRQSKGARLVLRNRISRKNSHFCDKFAGFNVISHKSSRTTEGGMVKNRATRIAQRIASGTRLTRFYPSTTNPVREVQILDFAANRTSSK